MRKLKTYSGVLVHFDEIMRNSLMDRKYAEFTMLSSVDDFQDGFVISQGHCAGALALRAFLKGQGLECLPLHSQTVPGYYFA